MLSEKITHPITLIDSNDFIKAIDFSNFKCQLRKKYESEYEWDYYLLRQNKIEFIKEKAPYITDNIEDSFWSRYYSGKIGDKDLEFITNQLSIEDFNEFKSIKPCRKRLISNFNLDLKNGAWKITRVPAGTFGQDDALINSENQDYRLSKRKFKELPAELECSTLKEMLLFTAKTINRNLESKPTKMNILVHHTLVYCYPNQESTNSPEGIHQDGMDYIVSAFVVERENIKGGKSILFGSDAKTPLFQSTLRPGQGLLQPDKNTQLWHTVTPIELNNLASPGYRSTIGLDITLT